MTASEYDSIRSRLSLEKRRLPMFSSKKFKGSASMALAVLQSIKPLPRLEPAWAYQISVKGEYLGTTQDEKEANEYKSQGASIKRVPSLYGGRRDVPSDLCNAAFEARAALHKAEQLLRQA